MADILLKAEEKASDHLLAGAVFTGWGNIYWLGQSFTGWGNIYWLGQSFTGSGNHLLAGAIFTGLGKHLLARAIIYWLGHYLLARPIIYWPGQSFTGLGNHLLARAIIYWLRQSFTGSGNHLLAWAIFTGLGNHLLARAIIYWLGQYSFRGMIIVIGTGFIPETLTSVHCFDNRYVGKQPVDGEDYCTEYWLKKLQESKDKSNGCHDTTEILLKTAIKCIQLTHYQTKKF